MSSSDHPSVGFDATPLASGHAVRGIGRYLAGLIEAMDQEDPDWTRTQLGLLRLRGQRLPIPAPGWRTRRSPVRPQDLDLLTASIADRWAIRRGTPHLWHHTDPTNPWSPVPADRTVVTVYDLIPLRVPSMLHAMRPHRRWAYHRYLRLVREARLTIAISETTAADVVELLGVSPLRIRVVPPHIAPPAGNGRPDASDRAAVSGRGAAARFLFVGVPQPHKRPLLAMDAFAAVVRRGVDAELSFAGVHPAPIRAMLETRARSLDVSERVHYLDRIDDAELERHYRRSVLVATSQVEGFGLPLVEALLAGGRVAATPTAAFQEAAGGAVSFSAGETPDAVADAMIDALDREPAPAQRRDLADRFAGAVAATALRSAYAEALGA
jgi:glycosyltransferase involved in cell wall biosynthesis